MHEAFKEITTILRELAELRAQMAIQDSHRKDLDDLEIRVRNIEKELVALSTVISEQEKQDKHNYDKNWKLYGGLTAAGSFIIAIVMAIYNVFFK